MKIDRLIGILSVLLQKEKVTAPYLAEKYEVSRRTINRDVEELCKAGIPIVTTRGPDGGIEIMEGFALDKTLLTTEEMLSIVAGLKGLDSVAATGHYQRLIDKLAPVGEEYLQGEYIVVDLGSYYKESIAEKIREIQQAIRYHRIVSFRYYSESGDSQRKIEPYLIVYRWGNWYVKGYCLDRKEMRLFKLNRLWYLVGGEDTFAPRPCPEERGNYMEFLEDKIQAEILFEETVKWRLIEDYGPESFETVENGKLLFKKGFTNKNYLIFWLMGFGDKAELLEPVDIREEIKAVIATMDKKYK